MWGECTKHSCDFNQLVGIAGNGNTGVPDM